MKLTNNFTLEELTLTEHKNVNNKPDQENLKHLQETAEMLQTLRDFYGNPIHINSGYRSPALNKLIGGSSTSAHSRGYAVDTVPSNGDMKTYQKSVLKWAQTHNFDQIIIEYPNIFNKTFHKDKRRPNSNTYAISCSANKADKFASILYDNSKIYLQRKYDRFAVLRRNS